MMSSEPRRGILLTVAYVGTEFHGFALQPNARTVAGELLGALRCLDPSIRSLRGVSRTDAGVHARGQLVAFDAERSIPPRGWVLGLLRHLPDSIATRAAVEVPVGFDPRGFAKRKWYRYTLLRDRCRDPFLHHITWRIADDLDLSIARTEAAALVGTHDFAAFRSSADERTSTLRTISAVAVRASDRDGRLVYIDVHGDGFLHNMVRIIVGTLVDVARHRLEPAAVARALVSLNRSDLGITAPADGLCLERVCLDAGLDGRSSWPAAGALLPEGAKRR